MSLLDIQFRECEYCHFVSVMAINVFFANPVTRTESYTKFIEYAVQEQLCHIYPVTSVVMSAV